MVEVLKHVIYPYTSPHTRALRTRGVDAVQILLIHDVEYFTLSEEWLRFELIISYHAGSDTMLKN